MKYRKIFFEIFVGIFSLTLTSTLLWSGEPGELVKEVIRKDFSLEREGVTNERKQELWEEVSYAFDFEEMAKRAMRNHWKGRSPDEKKEFVELFTGNLKSAYIKKTGSRFGEEIISLRERQKNKYAKVKVKLIKRTKGKMSADFLLIRRNGEWKICDVIIEGVSVISNYHSQINSFLIKSSYEELVQKLKQKQSTK